MGVFGGGCCFVYYHDHHVGIQVLQEERLVACIQVYRHIYRHIDIYSEIEIQAYRHIKIEI
jgi:hypothetical protein